MVATRRLSTRQEELTLCIPRGLTSCTRVSRTAAPAPSFVAPQLLHAVLQQRRVVPLDALWWAPWRLSLAFVLEMRGSTSPCGHIAHIADGPQPRPEVEPQPLAAREPWFLWQPGDPEYCAIERERLMAAFAQRQAAGGGEGPEGASGGVASSGLEVPSQIPASSATLGGGEGPEGAAGATASAAGASGGLGLIIAEVPR